MITIGSLSRSYIRHIPPGYSGKTPVPLMFDIHGLSDSPTGEKNKTGWGAVADAKGFIIVWPQGYMSSWNVGRCCNPAQAQNVDEVAFFKAMVAKLAEETCIDLKRVYATGCSNGGGMSYKLACDAADTFAAVAPVDFDCITGPMSSPSCAMCSPSRPITEVQFRGTSDTAVPYDGGTTPVVTGLVFPGAQTNFTTWGQINMCTGAPTPLPNNSACQQYPTCAGGVETTLCTMQNGTHCGSYQSFDIANVAWEQLQKYALP
jgi:polyhydroxybutyrate depolymerase